MDREIEIGGPNFRAESKLTSFLIAQISVLVLKIKK